MAHIQTQGEWEEEMSLKILSFVRSEIYLDLRYLNIALAKLVPKADDKLNAFATDGLYLYYSKEQLLRVFRKNAGFLNRAYLHTIFHCIFSHLWIAPEEAAGEGYGRLLWNTACDIAVEYTVDTLDKPCTKRILSWNRQRTYEMLRGERHGISAAVIYRRLKQMEENEVRCLTDEFFMDDHCYWPKREDSRAKQEIAAQNKKQWEQVKRQTRMEQEKRGDETEEGESYLAAQLKAEQSRRSYRDFLRKFSVLREELRSDPDEFDLNSYTYGLRLFHSMPLIEPVESREAKKIREFVIVVDTSYSTNGELVQNFLRETADILHQSDSFFSDSRIRILQCDNEVRRDTKVSGLREMESFLSDFELTGGGGTDFRPAFRYVDRLLEQGELKNLCGLLYFTDGKGIYPKRRPDYRTAFVFLEDYDEAAVPPWAIRQRLFAEEFI